MLDKELENKILEIMTEESIRIGYGKIVVTLTVSNSNIINMKAETERSVELKQYLKDKKN